MSEQPLQIGKVVAPWGKLAAVGVIGGERYYWFIRCQRGTETVSMIPAVSLEQTEAPRP